jgi:hypothetical protein
MGASSVRSSHGATPNGRCAVAVGRMKLNPIAKGDDHDRVT